MSNKITKNTTLAEILKNPELIKILTKYNLPCLGCPLAQFEMENLKIGEITEKYSLDVENLLKELNSVYEKAKK